MEQIQATTFSLAPPLAHNHTVTMDNHTTVILNHTVYSTSEGVEASPIFTFEFVVHGILILFVGLLGLVGNTICLAVLSRPAMKNSINCLLIGLVLVDNVIILSAFVLFSLPAFQV